MHVRRRDTRTRWDKSFWRRWHGPTGRITGISAREIQNNYFNLPLGQHYFQEPGADYIHIVTIGGEAGISLCAHPLYYEVANVKSGGCWRDIKQALLSPHDGGSLARLNVSGIEIYNGFTMCKLRERGHQHRYSNYEEFCWDELLMEGRLYWGFAGNDLFFHSRNHFNSFSPLGVVYADVPEGQSAERIVYALKCGRFYSSTGLELAETPIAVTQQGMTVQVEVRA